MSVIGSDSREVTTDFGTFPLSVVTTVDITLGGSSFIGSGIMIGPDHVLTAGHNAFDTDTNTNASALRTVLSSAEDALTSRTIGAAGDPAANVTNVNFLKGYDTSEAAGDDIALFTVSNSPISAAAAIGLVAFVDASDADGLTIDTAGYPGDIDGGRSLVISPGSADSPGEIVDTRSNGKIFYSADVDTAGGQSGSGIWTTLDGDSDPRVLGVHTQGTGGDNRFLSDLFGNRNSGVVITTDVYTAIADQMELDFSGDLAQFAADLPENAIIGRDGGFFSSGDDMIMGTFRRERIIAQDGDDRILGGGGDDRLEGGEGVDQALFSEEFANYDFTITDPAAPAFEFVHARGSQADGTDTTTGIEFGVFEFVDANKDGTDDDGNLFFVPLQVDPDDPTKLRDGPVVTYNEDILNVDGSRFGSLSAEIPAFMFDGDVDFTLNIGIEQNILFNFVYIVDSSGSMSGTRIQQTKLAFETLTNDLIASGVADNSTFGVVDFDSSARLFGNLSAQGAIDAVNALPAGGGTNFGNALIVAENYLESISTTGRSNIAFFLSDGFGSGASPSLQVVKEGTADETDVDVRAFGIGNGADLNSLSIIDSNLAEQLTDPADLVDAFRSSGLERGDIDRIDVKLGGVVIDTIDPAALIDDTFGLRFEGSIDGLEVSRTAENEVEFDVVFNNGTPTATLAAKITTGQQEVREQSADGTRFVVNFSVVQSDYTGDAENEEVNGNDLDNVIDAGDGINEINGNGGDDRFLINGGVNVVDGGDGVDTAVFAVTLSEAGGVSRSGNVVTVGTDHTFVNVEFIEFADVRIDAVTLAVVPLISISPIAQSLSEGDAGTSSADFEISLSSATTVPVTINFATRAGSADADADFVAAAGSVTFDPGDTVKTVSVDLLQDDLIEGTEDFFVDFLAGDGATFADGAVSLTAGVQITDDDSVITLSVTGDDFSVVEGDPDAPSVLSVTLERSGDLSGVEEVALSVGGTGTDAADAADFLGGFLTDTIVFAAGESVKTVDIAISGDTDFEADETFLVSLSSASGSAVIATEETTFTILNDDQADGPVEITGTDGSDNLVGTDADEVIRSLGGRYDKMRGNGGADQFIFGDETTNGSRDRSVILDYEVGIDAIVLEDGATIGAITQTSSSVVVFFDGDRDAVYVRGDGVTADNLTILTDDGLGLG